MSATLFVLCGLAAVALGSLCLYAASPNQRCLAQPWRRRPAHAAGAVLCVLALWSLGQAMLVLTASLVFGTALMLALVAWPYIGACLHVRRSS